MSTKTYENICKQQCDWATRHGIRYDNKQRTLQLNDNLFKPMSPETNEEFMKADGQELTGKIRSLHSSSALVCNFFDFWRGRDIGPLVEILDLPASITDINFEQIHSTPISRPNLDVEFCGTEQWRCAVESKFTESYLRKKMTLKSRYRNQWSKVKLRQCEQIAESIWAGEADYEYLDVPQLLKHILGLTTQLGVKYFRLLYLWYRVPSEETEVHQQELQRFKACIQGEVDFNDMTYRQLFCAMRRYAGLDEDYILYLKDRYFINL
jgi:hypothetical protein